MPSILAVSGSPSPASRTVAALDHALARLTAHGHTTTHLAVRDLPAADLLAGARTAPAVREAIAAVAHADGVIVATPIYKASYTGLLKAFLDLLPENALAGKVVLPVATGGTVGHLLAIDYALRPVLTALGADHVVPGRFLLDADIIRGESGDAYLVPEAERRLTKTLDRFTEALTRRDVDVDVDIDVEIDADVDIETAALALANGVAVAVAR
ncbi:NADPH-dependent FMN reductase [Catenulispora acidiphila DSM 44928]|uniref:NADPH-dependent FMN reductase n=1 Tax=Catenulispora acidiphila (strain DSM 44928 / JCM 14897 / NBRC 102108 / NRRL B-24433 / ID139908) TaxID=479433 RepID=C7QJS9_CATAD|nr:NADPH-dependent FMN reductase [Catenulispora acidiphila]ACU73167.1 NADPH-dependent FMN reductase [Catenulispora acidiphila DSM 44928]